MGAKGPQAPTLSYYKYTQLYYIINQRKNPVYFLFKKEIQKCTVVEHIITIVIVDCEV